MRGLLSFYKEYGIYNHFQMRVIYGYVYYSLFKAAKAIITFCGDDIVHMYSRRRAIYDSFYGVWKCI